MFENPIFDTFKDLYKCHTNLADYSGVFIKDGIINNELFKNSRERTLFIAKEHNLYKKYDPNNYAADYRIWWDDHVRLAFSVRISEWAFGIESGFSVPLDAINNFQRKKALQSIAFLNVKKKQPGGRQLIPRPSQATSMQVKTYFKDKLLRLIQHLLSAVLDTTIIQINCSISR